MTAEAGLLLVDKPAGVTSHDIVLLIRRALGVRRVGHTGTLDPFATGLLLVLVGSFTRLADLYHALPKSYEATMMLGRETDTDDPTGETVSGDAGWRELEAEAIRRVFAARRGTGWQVPPAYSARRTGGERAYARARRGERPELEASEVTIHEIAVTAIDPPHVCFRASVSTGTYVRALARDIGRELGPGAHLTALRRTGIGPFRVEEATAPDTAPEAAASVSPAWRPGMEALPWVPSRELEEAELEEIRHGRSVERGAVLFPAGSEPAGGAAVPRTVALFAPDGLVAIAEGQGWPPPPEEGVRRVNGLPPHVHGTVVTVGTFDGVHLGHRTILLDVLRRARARGGHSVLLTFDPHPLRVVRPEMAPPLLTLPNEKKENPLPTGPRLRRIPLLHAGVLALFPGGVRGAHRGPPPPSRGDRDRVRPRIRARACRGRLGARTAGPDSRVRRVRDRGSRGGRFRGLLHPRSPGRVGGRHGGRGRRPRSPRIPSAAL